MNWSDLIKSQIFYIYGVAEGLMNLVDDRELGWKPSSGDNWMTTGQLLMHMTNSCGAGVKGFVTGDWGFPEGTDFRELPPDEMLPPAEKMPSINSVAEAVALLKEDKKLTLDTLALCSEDRLSNEITAAPWDPTEVSLGHHLFQCVNHLNQHKGQLFYYLKLQGKPVHTGNLWGM